MTRRWPFRLEENPPRSRGPAARPAASSVARLCLARAERSRRARRQSLPHPGRSQCRPVKRTLAASSRWLSCSVFAQLSQALLRAAVKKQKKLTARFVQGLAEHNTLGLFRIGVARGG